MVPGSGDRRSLDVGGTEGQTWVGSDSDRARTSSPGPWPLALWTWLYIGWSLAPVILLMRLTFADPRADSVTERRERGIIPNAKAVELDVFDWVALFSLTTAPDHPQPPHRNRP